MTNVDQTIALVGDWPQLTPIERGDLVRRLQALADLTPQQVSALIAALVPIAAQPSEQGQTQLLAATADAILNSRADHGHPAARLTTDDVARLAELYVRLSDRGHSAGQILRLLATDAGPHALRTLADLLVERPPHDYRDAAWGITPLVQRTHFDLGALFPRLLDGLAHRQTAALILDLANFAARRNLAPVHPAASRASELAALLGQLVNQLGRIEEKPWQFAQSPEQLRATVDESVALCIALCDALGLIGDSVAVPKLHQALEVGHRRIRTEAAAALARFQDQRGFQALVELSADPATRTRALAYLEELGAIEQVPPANRSPKARAAGELADWISEPAQLGAPPHAVEWIDTCRQYWPGYTDPVDCRLFVYTYHLRDGELSGVGIVGPVTYALSADLEDLPPDDIYAAFAGWQAEHEELQEIAADDLPEWKRKAFQSRLEQLAAAAYRDVRLVKVGHFFGDEILVATAQREGHAGTLVVDGDQLEWYPAGATRRPIGPTEAYYIHKGRKLLSTFNPDGVEHIDESAPPAEEAPDRPQPR